LFFLARGPVPFSCYQVHVRHVGSGLYLAVDHDAGPEASDDETGSEVRHAALGF